MLAYLLEQLPMPDPIVQALVHESERGDFGQIARYAADIASSPEEVNLAQLQSLAWTEELTSEVAPAAAEPATP